MKIVLFYHSLLSDWNHGNAHFLRGTIRELLRRGHDVSLYEPKGNWSLTNLTADHGDKPLIEFSEYYPMLKSHFYDTSAPLKDQEIFTDADLVIVHEWNEPELVAAVGKFKTKYGYKLLFHDTHHRAVSDIDGMLKYDFTNYDGALVFGKVIREIYKKKKWIEKVWTWHEAADVALFKPIKDVEKEGDLVWIGNWGDDERKEELNEFLIKPVKALGLKAKVYGVRYPKEALAALKDAGIEYGGYLPNYKVPEVFSKYKVTVHVPRGPYTKLLPGIPTIRPFEAMACGIPMISAPWKDVENLFTPGVDFLTAKNGGEMRSKLEYILSDEKVANKISQAGRITILNKHTCSHRINELELVAEQLGIAENLVYPTTNKSMAI
jgi:spore maturation protein CgeB